MTKLISSHIVPSLPSQKRTALTWYLAVSPGLLITYTIMLGDVLVGKAPEYNGVVTNLTGIHSGDVWYLDRRFVVTSAIPCIQILRY